MKSPDGNKLTILNALNQGVFVSGQKLAEQLEISRTAVAKHIQSLQQMGLDIYRVNGKGYRLAAPLSLLDQEKITQHYLNYSHTPPQFITHSVIDSTNAHLLRQLQQGTLELGTTLVAEMQEQGRGRRGRQWQSPFGANLYYSHYWRLDDGLHGAMGVSIAVGLAVHDCLSHLYQLNATLKWPNDVLIEGKKLAGILVELDGQTQGPCHLVIGIGINLAMPKSSAEQIDQPWCDLSHHVEKLDKNQLTAALTFFLQQRLVQYQQTGLSQMYQHWNRQHAFQGKKVTLSTGSNSWSGICEGIDEQGAIILRSDGQNKRYFGGEISLRASQ